MKKQKLHKILWVDDDIGRLRAFVDEFYDEGYQVLKATTPEEMQTILSHEENAVDLIIMDLILPTGSSLSAEDTNFGKSTGQKLIEQIKEEGRFIEIPIVLFTINSNKQIEAWCRTNNIDLLRKATTLPSDLIKRVEKLLMEL